jgi:hypothetical protein
MRDPVTMRILSRLVVPLALAGLALALAACAWAFGWHLGDVADWLAGLGAFGAAGSALYIATKDRQERADERLAAAEAQAKLVIVTPMARQGGGTIVYTMHYHNYGDQPILDVTLSKIELRAYPRAVAKFEARIDRLVRAEESTGSPEAKFVDDKGTPLPRPFTDDKHRGLQWPDTNEVGLVGWIAFTDTKGNRWAKSSEDELRCIATGTHSSWKDDPHP